MDGTVIDGLRAAVGKRVVVVGGANVDIVGIPDAVPVSRDSNPGHVRQSAGGVARNIAENLARLGVHTELITAYGDDDAGRAIVSSCAHACVGLSGALEVPGVSSARYLAITDERHDMTLAINDMRALDRLTPQIMRGPLQRALLDAAHLIVADANLRQDTLAELLELSECPLALDAVSAPKAARLAGALKRAAMIKCTAAEAAVLTGHGSSEGDPSDAEPLALGLLERGVGSVFISYGAHGVFWASAAAAGWAEAPAVSIANTTGAGDAFAAGAAFAQVARADAETAARFGTALAALTLADEATVSEAVTFEAALATMEGAPR